MDVVQLVQDLPDAVHKWDRPRPAVLGDHAWRQDKIFAHVLPLQLPGFVDPHSRVRQKPDDQPRVTLRPVIELIEQPGKFELGKKRPVLHAHRPALQPGRGRNRRLEHRDDRVEPCRAQSLDALHELHHGRLADCKDVHVLDARPVAENELKIFPMIFPRARSFADSCDRRPFLKCLPEGHARQNNLLVKLTEVRICY